MRCLVISSCTADKAVDHPERLVLADFRDAARRTRREGELTDQGLPAADLYTGQQHLGMMRGVRRLRAALIPDSVDVMIVSAGYGLVSERQILAPYEATFDSMSAHEARNWAHELRLPEHVRTAARSYEIAVFLLGGRYLDAIAPPLHPEPGQRLIFLAKPTAARRLQAVGVTIGPAGQAQTCYGAGYVALKGRMFELFAAAASRDPSWWQRIIDDERGVAFLEAVEAGLSSA